MPAAKMDQLMRGLKKLLEGPSHPPGGRLPAERKLCVELGVSRTLLRAGLAQLEAEGRIWRHVGQGTFVGSPPVKSDAAAVFARALTSPSEVMETRLLIEPRLAALAAMRATKDDVTHLRNVLAKLERSPNHANYARWDSTFHRSIAEAAHNALLLMVFDAVNAVRTQDAWINVWERTLTPNRPLFGRQHEQILDAIAAHDPQRAQELMRLHLESVSAGLGAPMGAESVGLAAGGGNLSVR